MKKRRGLGGFAAMALLLLATALLCLCVGSVSIPPSQAAGALIQGVTGLTLLDFSPESQAILLAIRLPRVLLAMLVGASLSVAGAAMQALLKNPLADGSTLGVSAGGSLGAVLVIAAGWVLPWLPQLSVTVAGIAFSFGSLMLILAFAKGIDRNFSSHTIILTGVIFSMLAASITSLVIAFSGDAVRQIVFWSMGSLAGRGYAYVGILAALAVPAMSLILLRARELDAFALGEEQAAYAGVNVPRVRMSVLVCTSVLCGAAVSVCGNIAFVGLAVPHLVRLAIGPSNARLLPASAVAGAVFLALCDLLSRTVLSPVELPIGVITSIAGAAAFIVLFYRQRTKEV